MKNNFSLPVGSVWLLKNSLGVIGMRKQIDHDDDDDEFVYFRSPVVATVLEDFVVLSKVHQENWLWCRVAVGGAVLYANSVWWDDSDFETEALRLA